MSYEKVDTDNVLDNLQRIVQDNLGNIEASTPPSTGQIQLMSQGNKGDSFGQTTGLKSDTQIIANLTDLDEAGAPTGTTDRISLGSSLTIVDYSVPAVNIELRHINFKPAAGTHVKFTPKAGRTLVIKTGGDFANTSDITISDNEYLECVFYDETESGITGGGFKPHKLGTSGGGGGEFFGPWTADHDAGGFDLVDMSQIFFGSGFTKSIGEIVGGVGIFAGVSDEINFLINLVSKVTIDNTEISTDIDIDMNQHDIRDLDNLEYLGGDSIIDDATLGGLTMLLGSTREFRIFRGVPQIATFGNQIDFDVQLNMDDNNIAEIQSLLFDEGDSIQGGTSEFAFITASGDIESHYNNITKVYEMSASGIQMEGGKSIGFDDNTSSDFLLITQTGGISDFLYTGDLKFRESGADVLTLGSLLIQAEKDLDMGNNEIDDIFTVEINENFGPGGVPVRPSTGCKLFCRQQFAPNTAKTELRAYFPTGSSQLIIAEP